MESKLYLFSKYSLFSLIVLLASIGLSVYAQEEEEIKEKIEQRSENIERLEREIAEYQSEINTLSKEKQTLENTIQTLRISERKLNADIELVESKIAVAEDAIEELQGEISKVKNNIKLNKDAISKTLKSVQQESDKSLVEAMLRHDNLSDYWGEMDSLFAFQKSVSASIDELAKLQNELEDKRKEQEELREEQLALRGELEAKAGLVVENKEEQSQLLAVTENKESEYQKMLRERKARKQAFEAEIQELESQLNLNVDPGSVPSARPGVLGWPVDNVNITQYFGNTAFATSNPQVYSGGGHNGIDFGVGMGTGVKAAESGVVVDTGNTDQTCRGASYGRWILLRHNNNLSTLYAHLSRISVSKGETVKKGEVIGYSGNSGYSTGPHLHFTVYATSGVQVTTMPSRGCSGAVYRLPLSDPTGYLNPLSFL